jgi:phosphoadenosine phosphosulfate reductase
MADVLERPASSGRQWTTADVEALSKRFEASGSRRMIETMLAENAGKRIALVSSFGSNSVVLLHLVASVDRNLPVLFVDTGRLFGSTLAYRDQLAAELGLTNIRSVGPETNHVVERDPAGALWVVDPDACCALRKVEPLAKALCEFDIWISGRKRYQGGSRGALPIVEADGSRIKVNPLAGWTSGDIDIYRTAFSLPQHPLVEKGYRSIGCEPCTSPVAEGEDERAGRWRGKNKTECGIHLPAFSAALMDAEQMRSFG